MNDNSEITPAMVNIKSATPLSALQLNSYKLDEKHTVLTPDYLENLQS